MGEQDYPFEKPRVRLFGDTTAAQLYLGAAYKLLYKVRAFCQTSGVPVFSLRQRLSDGAIVTAGVFEGESVVACYPPTHAVEAAVPEIDLIPPEGERFYMDSGWLFRGTQGAVTSLKDALMELRTTSNASSTYSQISEVVEKYFDPAYGSERAGRSVGLGYDFDSIQDEVERESVKKKYADVLQEKIRSIPALLRTTGLLRAYVKGQFGRELSDGFDLSFVSTQGMRTMKIGPVQITIGAAGIVFDDNGFYLLAEIIPGGRCPVWRMSYPEALEGLFKEFLEASGKAKVALATYLLSYSTVELEYDENGTPKAEQPNRRYIDVPQSFTPSVGGWQFALLKNKFHGTHGVPAPGKASAWGLTEFTVSPPNFDEGIDGSMRKRTLDGGVYVFGETPRVWFPEMNGELTMVSNNEPNRHIGDSYPYSFYDENDEIVRGRVALTSYDNSGTKIIKDIDTTACGGGASERRIKRSLGLRFSVSIGVGNLSSGGTSHASLSEDIVTGESPGPGGEVFLGEGIISTGCSVNGTGASPSEFSNMYWLYAKTRPVTFTNGTLTSLETPRCALVVPDGMPECLMMLDGIYIHQDGSLAQTIYSGEIGGYKMIPNPTANPTGKGQLDTMLNVPRQPASATVSSFTQTRVVPADPNKKRKQTITATAFSPHGNSFSVSETKETSDNTFPSIPLEVYVVGSTGPLSAPRIVSSLHTGGWGFISPSYPLKGYGGIEPPPIISGYIADFYPIGFQ